MGPDDFLDTEVGVAVAAAAVLFSPRVRGLLRRGLVNGLGMLLSATDLIGGASPAWRSSHLAQTRCERRRSGWRGPSATARQQKTS